MLKREQLTGPLWILFGSLMLLLLLGSVWDSQLGTALFGDPNNPICRTISAVGELPAFLLFVAAGVTWLVRRGRRKRWVEWFSLAGGLCFIAGGSVLTFLSFREDLPGASVADCAVFSGIFLAAALAFGLFLTRNASRADCFRLIFTVLFAGAFAMLAVNLIKYPWSRPRVLLLSADEAVAFSPWWQPRGFGDGFRSDGYRSFPSGHTAMAACSLLFTLFPALNQRFEGRGRLFLLISCLWTALVALSRMTVGAHFLSDVAISWLFMLLMYRLSVLLFWRDGRIFQKLYNLLT